MAAVRDFVKGILDLYLGKKVLRASAAMSYYLTMTVFPLVICLYALFGQSYDAAMTVFGFLERFLTPSASELFRNFLVDLSLRSSNAVVAAAIVTLVLSASAVIRVLQGTLGEMQGGRRFRAVADYLISFVLAAALVAAIYFSMVVLLTGQQFLEWLQTQFGISLDRALWSWLRFILLGGIAMLVIWALFGFMRPKEGRYLVLPGAAFATAGIVVMGGIFSRMIVSSARYSLVYGSLASLILLMLWMYLVCQIIFIGAALNIVLRDRDIGQGRYAGQEA